MDNASSHRAAGSGPPCLGRGDRPSWRTLVGARRGRARGARLSLAAFPNGLAPRSGDEFGPRHRPRARGRGARQNRRGHPHPDRCHQPCQHQPQRCKPRPRRAPDHRLPVHLRRRSVVAHHSRPTPAGYAGASGAGTSARSTPANAKFNHLPSPPLNRMRLNRCGLARIGGGTWTNTTRAGLPPLPSGLGGCLERRKRRRLWTGRCTPRSLIRRPPALIARSAGSAGRPTTLASPSPRPWCSV